MDLAFLKLLNMSITAGWLALAVIILRPLLKKAPKWIMGVLWAFVAIRLICPVSLKSVFSLIPSAEPISPVIAGANSPAIDNSLPSLNGNVNSIFSGSLSPSPSEGSVNPMQVFTFIASIVWIAGVAAMLLYTLVSFLRLYGKVREAVPFRDNIWICDRIATPFILGIFRPRIYLPSSVGENDREFVLFHEKAHLRRRDHIWKPLGFLLLTVYWFNPLLWVAYILLCKDIELACDEKVIRELGAEIKKPYSNALINCSVPRRTITACPLAFGEVGVRTRVKSVLNYKKPSFWIVLTAVIACIVTAICLMTNPKKKDEANKFDNVIITDSGTDYEGVSWMIDSVNKDLNVFLSWTNDTDKDIFFGNAFSVYKVSDAEGTVDLLPCKTKEAVGFNAIAYLVKSSDTYQSSYRLRDYYDITSTGKHRLTVAFTVSGDRKTYTAWADFIIGRDVVTIEHQYRASSWIYDCGYGITDLEKEQFRISEDMVLMHNDFLTPNWYDIGRLTEFQLTEDNFDKLAISPIWEDGYSAAKIRRENRKAYRALKENYSSRDIYYIFYQENGDIYMAKSCEKGQNSAQAGANIQWIYKMKSRDSGSHAVQRVPHHWFDATVLEVNHKTILVCPDESSNERKSADKIWVSLDVISTNILPELHVDDKVTIGYYGNMAESYPAQINWTAVIYNRDEFDASYWSTGGGTYGPFYHYKGTSEILGATLALHKDNTFDFSWSLLDCYGAAGYYELTDTTLTLITDNGKYQFVFDVKDNAFLFNESKSSKLPRYRFKNSDAEPVPPVPDKAAFVPAP